MNSLHKVVFLLLICMSISSSSLSIPAEQKLKDYLLTHDKINIDMTKLDEVAYFIRNEVFESGCNCEKLKELDDSQLSIAENLLFFVYRAPKNKKNLKREKEKLTKLFTRIDKDMLTAHIKDLEETNEKMRCMEKMMITINKLRKE